MSALVTQFVSVLEKTFPSKPDACSFFNNQGQLLLKAYHHETEYGIDVMTTLGHVSYMSFNVMRVLNVDFEQLLSYGIPGDIPAIHSMAMRREREVALNAYIFRFLEEQFENLPEMVRAYILYANSDCMSYILADFQKGIINDIALVETIKKGIPPEPIFVDVFEEKIERATHLASRNASHQDIAESYGRELNVLRDTLDFFQRHDDMQLMATFHNIKVDHYFETPEFIVQDATDDFSHLFNVIPAPRKKKKDVKRLRKRLMRGVRLFSMLNPKETDIHCFINGDTMVLSGEMFDYYLSKKSCQSRYYNNIVEMSDDMETSTISYNLWVVDKSGSHIARLCAYIPNTPIIDQIVALSVRIREAEMEISFLQEANIMEITDFGSKHASFIEIRKKAQQSVLPIEVNDLFYDEHEQTRNEILGSINFNIGSLKIFDNINFPPPSLPLVA